MESEKSKQEKIKVDKEKIKALDDCKKKAIEDKKVIKK